MTAPARQSATGLCRNGTPTRRAGNARVPLDEGGPRQAMPIGPDGPSFDPHFPIAIFGGKIGSGRERFAMAGSGRAMDSFTSGDHARPHREPIAAGGWGAARCSR